MMNVDYRGCSVFVNDAQDNPLACTTVLDYNSGYMTITIPRTVCSPEPGAGVTVLIIAEGTIHEYQGKLRRSVNHAMATDIALFKGRVKESRQAKRFAVNAPAEVPALMIEQMRAPLLNPLRVQVVNLSSSGALLRARHYSFSDHAMLEMRMNMGGQDTNICAQIVRARRVDAETDDYGCRFIAAE